MQNTKIFIFLGVVLSIVFTLFAKASDSYAIGVNAPLTRQVSIDEIVQVHDSNKCQTTKDENAVCVEQDQSVVLLNDDDKLTR